MITFERFPTFETWQEKRAFMLGLLYALEIRVREITCDECPSAKDGTCDCAWDAYNTDGSCLEEK
jgi:hypothetical protein